MSVHRTFQLPLYILFTLTLKRKYYAAYKRNDLQKHRNYIFFFHWSIFKRLYLHSYLCMLLCLICVSIFNFFVIFLYSIVSLEKQILIQKKKNGYFLTEGSQKKVKTIYTIFKYDVRSFIYYMNVMSGVVTTK